MTDEARLYRTQAMMLIAVSVPLAMAEMWWAYPAAVVVSAILGWIFVIRRGGTFLPPWVGRAIILLAFMYAITEYMNPEKIAILALGHFMTVVCCAKLLQPQTLRDQAHVLVLSLLLLVIAGIVSDHAVFPTVLLVYLTFGITAMLQFQLQVESYFVHRRNALICAANRESRAMRSLPGGRAVLRGMAAAISGSALAIGIVIFILFPRFGVTVLPETEGLSGGHSITGLGGKIDFQGIGPLRLSNRPVMRVIVRRGDGKPISTSQPFHFRSTVLLQYHLHREHGLTRWEWLQAERNESQVRDFVDLMLDRETGKLTLIPELAHIPDSRIIEQEYLIESADDSSLFAHYPAIEFRSPSLSTVRLCRRGQQLEHPGLAGNAVRYTIRSLDRIDESAAAILADRYGTVDLPKPRALPPVPKLPQDEEIRDLVREEVGDFTAPVPREQWGDFARRVETFLSSRKFNYTLQLPVIPHGKEPIGWFLLDHKEGNCQYFASAMVVLCQMYGIPARLVEGYCSNEYNDIGRFYVVRQQDAHAWAEVYTDDHDWVRYDPTPAATRASVGPMREWMLGLWRIWDFLQFRWTDFVVAYDSGRRSELFQSFGHWLKRPVREETGPLGAVTAFVRELFGGRLKLTTRERLIYWAFALSVLVLVVLLLYVFGYLCWWLGRRIRRALSARQRLRGYRGGTEFYHRFCRHLSAMGLHRPSHQTPAEFAAQLAGQYPAFADAPLLVEAYYAVAFGGRELPPARQDRINVFLGKLRQMDASQLALAGSA